MPIPAYMKISDFEGSVDVEGRTGTIEILAVDHQVHIPVDRKDGTAAGTRVHSAFKITKNFDQASPELYNAMCRGKKIPEVVVNWYKIDPTSGQEVVYFTHTLTDARVVSVKAVMPDVDDPVKEDYKHREEVAFRYEKITWNYAEGNIEHWDAWKEGRG